MKRLYLIALVMSVALTWGSTVLAQAVVPASTDGLGSFEMTWAKRQPGAISARAGAAAEVFTGEKLVAPRIVARKAGGKRLQLSIPEAPALEVTYLADYDELRIVDRELMHSTAPKDELSQDEAVKRARRLFDELARRRLIDERQFRWDNLEVASTWVGRGAVDGSTAEERKRIEYRITLRRVLNGIEVANAGIRIGVHVSGRVSSLRLGGVSIGSRVKGDVDEPIGKGRWSKRQVATEGLKARFEREIGARGNTRIAWAREMYVMPENKRTAIVAPMYVVSYSLAVPTDDDQLAVSRRKTIGFSLTEPQAAPMDLTPPVRTPVAERSKKPYSVKN
jgi:hypothetical protein